MKRKTKELFFHDPYLGEFEARVGGISGREVWLEQTAFYPGGGGRPHDKGRLKVGPVGAGVVDVRRRDGGIVHVTDKPLPQTVGRLVGELDWARRYAHMRHHTALYVLSAVLRRDFGAETVSGNGGKLYADRARLDLSLPGLHGVADERAAEVVENIKLAVNSELSRHSPVRVYEVQPEEAVERPDPAGALESLESIEGFVSEEEPVRVVEVRGLDVRVDGGLHVANTGEVGGIEDIKITNRKSRARTGGQRLEFTLT